MNRFPPAALAFLALLQPAFADDCTRVSGRFATPLVELYTSQGCSSCPPAERWLTGLKSAGGVVALEFHVNYWDELGWKDPLADPRYTERQRANIRASGARSLYTPQVVVGGRDMPAWRDDAAFAAEARRIRQRVALGTIALAPRMSAEGIVHADLAVTLDSRLDPSRHELVVALAEDGLLTRVTAGENRGRDLAQDFVVRDLASWRLSTLRTDRIVRLRAPGQASRRLSVAAFVRDRESGDVLQALSRPICE